jgi:hypothetical protein
MSFYSDLAVTAAALISQFGQAVTFTRPTGSFTPGVGIGAGSTTYPATLVAESYSVGEVDGMLIEAGDMKALVSSTTPPEMGDNVPVNGKTRRVQNVTPLAPGGEVIFYELQLRN